MNRLVPLPQYFHQTREHPCPYIPGQIEQRLVTGLEIADSSALYSELSRVGFRRSHNLAYRPACRACSACKPVRIDAAGFVASRSIRRLDQINADLSVCDSEPIATPEQYRLFTRYQQARHGDSEMAGMSFAEFRMMIEGSPIETILASLRDRAGTLVATCLTDVLDDGVSAVYSYFEPGLPKRSLGTFLVRQLVNRVRRTDRRYVYLGYWIAQNPKMGYKTRFRPLEALGPGGWVLLDSDHGD
ncbi:MAG: leucyl-tRNA---protein transferase [Aliidongia sp.]|jgi:arginine-tRNA-protein transferase|nr:leucyl-tRNA---protein transferase [Aliidongia sp.]